MTLWWYTPRKKGSYLKTHWLCSAGCLASIRISSFSFETDAICALDKKKTLKHPDVAMLKPLEVYNYWDVDPVLSIDFWNLYY